ncbi:MAG: phosphodiester glycosidase family protein [Thermosynechococcaceae cyanobacterium]
MNRPFFPLMVSLALVMSAPALAQTVTQQGSVINLNGRTLNAAWATWPAGTGQTIGISDSGLRQRMGFDLLSTSNYQQQPVSWFTGQPTVLNARLAPSGAYRYLDVATLSQTFGWRLQPQGNVLQITSPAAQVQSVRVGRQTWGNRIVVDLDRPAPWQMTQLTVSRDAVKPRSFKIALDAAALPAATQRWAIGDKDALRTLAVTTQGGQTIISGEIAGNMRPQISMVPNPNRLVIDIQANAPQPRSIQWAPGIQWQEQTISSGGQQFPVVWLALNPQQPGLKLRPIWGNPNALVGIDPLLSMAARSQVAVAINGGYFNRKNQTTLGAIRRDGQWVSSPVLSRGAVAWTDQGQFAMGRLALQETLTTPSGSLAVVSRDSGYPQRGIALYTPVWGPSYTPILETEKIISVVGDRVVDQRDSKSASSFPIPRNGYLLVLRSFDAGAALAPGSSLTLQATASPTQFNQFPNILGAGPLLVYNNQVVLNANAEQFSPAFGTQAAPRSGIGQRSDGTIILAAAHNRVNGMGPTLKEWAEIMRQLGSVQALNLDGGSSTALYLGGQLLDRHPSTAARVQNGLGVSLTPAP